MQPCLISFPLTLASYYLFFPILTKINLSDFLEKKLPPNHFAAAATAAKSLQSCPTLCDPIDGSHQAPLSLGFSRQES